MDSNVLLDVLTDDRVWFGWSSEALAAALDAGGVVINPIVYAEVSVGFDRIEDLDAVLPSSALVREPLPYAAGFVAGKAFVAYRRRGGARVTPLPDFYIGAHALVAGYRILTRDARRYRTYFPRLDVAGPTSET
ncbi:MAG TPA: type II toxin-antitoxin system VapC family toxin [Microlunatus sp.]|nr:type II toxin-antitoxin system VapC family toxin [Microlunatus sp.]